MLHGQQQRISVRSNVAEWTHALLANTTRSCQLLRNLSSGLATSDLDSSVTREAGRVHYTVVDLLQISLLYRSTWLLLGCILNGTLRTKGICHWYWRAFPSSMKQHNYQTQLQDFFMKQSIQLQQTYTKLPSSEKWQKVFQAQVYGTKTFQYLFLEHAKLSAKSWDLSFYKFVSRTRPLDVLNEVLPINKKTQTIHQQGTNFFSKPC